MSSKKKRSKTKKKGKKLKQLYSRKNHLAGLVSYMRTAPPAVDTWSSNQYYGKFEAQALNILGIWPMYHKWDALSHKEKKFCSGGYNKEDATIQLYKNLDKKVCHFNESLIDAFNKLNNRDKRKVVSLLTQSMRLRIKTQSQIGDYDQAHDNYINLLKDVINFFNSKLYRLSPSTKTRTSSHTRHTSNTSNTSNTN